VNVLIVFFKAFFLFFEYLNPFPTYVLLAINNLITDDDLELSRYIIHKILIKNVFYF